MAGDRADWEYDSTWEDQDPDSGSELELERRRALVAQKKKPNRGNSYQRTKGISRNWRAAKDMQRYRHHYPDLQDRVCDAESMRNLKFYKNEMQFQPNGIKIEELLESWSEDYETLEDKHTYIQWLFPLREGGMNWHAKPLTLKEIEEFKTSAEVMERLVKAYDLMLGFYGIRLVARDTGEVTRAENWKERFQNLNWHTHNNLRITRILKCLGEMGYEHYQVPLVKFFLKEILVEGTLPNVKFSALDYFIFTIRNKQERRQLVHYAWKHFRPRENFVWGPLKKLQRFEAQRRNAVLHPVTTTMQGEDERLLEEGNPVKERRLQTKTVVRKDASQDPALEGDSEAEQGNVDGGEKGPSADAKIANDSTGTAKDCKKRKLDNQAAKSSVNRAEQPNSPDVNTISNSLQGISMSQHHTDTPLAESAVGEKGSMMQSDVGVTGDVTESGFDTTKKRKKADQTKEEEGNIKFPPSPGDVEETLIDIECDGEEPLKRSEESLKRGFSSSALDLTQQPSPEERPKESNAAIVGSKDEMVAACDDVTLKPGTHHAEGDGCMESGKEVENTEDPGKQQYINESTGAEAAEGTQERSPLTTSEGFLEPLEHMRATTTELADEANALNRKTEDVPKVKANGMELPEGNREEQASKNSPGSSQTPVPLELCNPKGNPSGDQQGSDASASTAVTSKRPPAMGSAEQDDCEAAHKETGDSSRNGTQDGEGL